MSLRSMTFSSILIGTVTVFRLLSQFFVLPFLARYLSPEDYGVIALATPFILFSFIFTNSGIGASLLRDKEKDTNTWSASFWFVTASGIFFMLLIMGISPIAAWFFDAPLLQPVLMWMSVGTLLQSLFVIPVISLRYDHRFGVLSFIQIFSIVLGMGTVAIVVVMDGGVWALVLQGLVQHGCLAFLSFLTSKFNPRFVFKLSIIKEHLSFGYTVMGAAFVDFLNETFRSFAVAKILGTVFLGYYSIALVFLNLPNRIIRIVFQQVLYTYLVQFHDNIEFLRNMMLLITRVLTVILFPVMGMLAIAHEPVFHVILSEKWEVSGTLFMLAAPGAALFVLSPVRIIFLQITGEVRKNLRYSIESFVLQAVLLLVFIWHGLEWAVISLALSWGLYFLRDTAVILKELACDWLSYLNTIIPTILMTTVGIFVYKTLIGVIEGETLLIQMGIAVLIGFFVLIFSAAIQYPAIKKEVRFLKERFL